MIKIYKKKKKISNHFNPDTVTFHSGQLLPSAHSLTLTSWAIFDFVVVACLHCKPFSYFHWVAFNEHIFHKVQGLSSLSITLSCCLRLEKRVKEIVHGFNFQALTYRSITICNQTIKFISFRMMRLQNYKTRSSITCTSS